MLEAKVMQEKMKGIVQSVLLGVILYAILMVILSFLMWITPISEKWIGYYGLALLCISCFVSGMKSGYTSQSKGLIWGIFSGFCVTLILLLLYFILFHGGDSSYENLWKPFVSVICGAIGGIVGANAK